jgi:hypothetical protein
MVLQYPQMRYLGIVAVGWDLEQLSYGLTVPADEVYNTRR